MFNFTKGFSFVFLEFLDIHSFVNMACLNKEYLEDICYYFKAKKEMFDAYKIKKTLDNCFLKIPRSLLDVGSKARKNLFPSYQVIVKVVKSSSNHRDNRGENRLKIYFWMISHPKKIGKPLNGREYVIYPEWSFLKEEYINDKTLIPFR